jgi:hypothetical protein
MRDYQKTKVYKWEDKHIAPRDTVLIKLDIAKVIVKYVWVKAGLEYPPKVELIPAQTKRLAGCASRAKIKLQPQIKTWIVLHEIAHSMNSSNIDDSYGDRHGPNYVGIYMKLLAEHNVAPLPLLMYTATEAGIDFNLEAQPLFLSQK